eukprot:sb/3475611/
MMTNYPLSSSQIHGKYDNSSMRTLAKVINTVAPRFYIPSKSLALDPVDVVGNASDSLSPSALTPGLYQYGGAIPHLTVTVTVRSARSDGSGAAAARQLRAKCKMVLRSTELLFYPSSFTKKHGTY